MIQELPGEILTMILACRIDVPDQDFADITPFGNSPFVSRQVSSESTTPLLVCKLWLRVCTPLLYDTVILRSTAQAEALVAALKDSPSLGLNIKKLRVEGGFGKSVRKAIEFSTRLTHICLSITYTSGEKVKPMCIALARLTTVRRLIVHGPFTGASNANIRLSLETMAQCIKSWGSLRVVYLHSTVACSGPIREALMSATQISEVYFPESKPTSDLDDFILTCPTNVRRIRVGWLDPKGGRFLPELESDEQRKGALYTQGQLGRVIFSPQPKLAYEAKPRNPSFQPMQDVASAVRRKIWLRVFELLFEESNAGSACDDNTEAQFSPKYCCMLVCSEFRELVLELSCRHPFFWAPSQVESFALALQKHAYLSSHVASLRLQLQNYSPSLNDQCFALVKSFLPGLVNMHALKMTTRGCPLQPDQFHALLTVSEGLSELELHLSGYYGKPSPAPFEFQLPLFASLTRLTLVIEIEGMSHVNAPPAHALSALEYLRLKGHGCGHLLRMLPYLVLPFLREVHIADVYKADTELESLCRVHGPKLRKLSVKQQLVPSLMPHCPNIEFLVYPTQDFYSARDFAHQDPPESQYLRRLGVFHRLQEISCPCGNLYLGPGIGQLAKQLTFAHIAGWTKFFDFLLRTQQFPALKVMRLEDTDNIWPTTEQEIAKSPFPQWAENLLEGGIRLVDCNSVGWTPRLKSRGRR